MFRGEQWEITSYRRVSLNLEVKNKAGLGVLVAGGAMGEVIIRPGRTTRLDQSRIRHWRIWGRLRS
jgi:hypothetical protein